MPADYPLAQWLPSPNFWAGGDGNKYIVVHATASGGTQTGYQLATSAEFTDGKTKSVHYINDVDGTVYQIVREADSAWGNCCATGASLFDHSYNYNKNTISIENVKHSSDNSEPLTPAQYQSLLALIRDICARQGIPMQPGTPALPGIIFHHDLDPINKSGCPGTFPYDTFMSDLIQTRGVPVKLNSSGMVLDIVQSFQLESGESGDLCGMWAVSSLRGAGLPGSGTRLTAEQVDQWADAEANKYMVNGAVSWPGSSITDEENFIKDSLDPVGGQRNLKYWEITPTVDRVRVAVQAGYPVIITAYEPNIFSWNGTSWVAAYPWNISANHVLPVLGIDNMGNFICADQLNNNYQGRWPVIYDASRISPSYAAVIQVLGPDPANPWLAPIPNGDPLTWPAGFNAQLFTQGVPPVTTVDYKEQVFELMWRAVVPAARVDSGIAALARADFMAGRFHGPALTAEVSGVDLNGAPAIYQFTPRGWYAWQNGKGSYVSYA